MLIYNVTLLQIPRHSNTSVNFSSSNKFLFSIEFLILRIDIESLNTIGTRDVKKHVGVVNHTSHPHIMNDGTVSQKIVSIRIN